MLENITKAVADKQVNAAIKASCLFTIFLIRKYIAIIVEKDNITDGNLAENSVKPPKIQAERFKKGNIRDLFQKRDAVKFR